MAKLLVIDDDENMRGFLSDILSMAGHTVSTAVDGQEGLAKFLLTKYDLVVTDIVMPNKEGIEVIRDLRHHNPEIKIIAISGGLNSSDFYLEIAQKLGADLSIKKPFSHNSELLEAINKLLN